MLNYAHWVDQCFQFAWLYKIPIKRYVLAGFYLLFVFSHKLINFECFRLTPPYAVIVLVNVSLMKHLGSGPQWHSLIQNLLEQPCREYWWAALLYVQNYVNPSQQVEPDFFSYIHSKLIIYFSVHGPNVVFICRYSIIYYFTNISNFIL